jgi:2-polyprenyl-3-methyl-5-hydroxy-6-metoxy-1,4-benzoquinol methylase
MIWRIRSTAAQLFAAGTTPSLCEEKMTDRVRSCEPDKIAASDQEHNVAAEAPLTDYGWHDTRAEDSHAYLAPVVLAALERVVAGVRGRPPRIFDAGCGNGALLGRMHERGWLVAGCDASPSGVTHARTALGPSVRIECASVYDDLAHTFGADWDIVVSTEVIEHLYSPRAFVQRVKGLLAPGGHLILSTPYHGYLKNLVMAAAGKLDAHFTALWDGGHIKFWSQRTLQTLLVEQGFGPCTLLGAGRLPYLWKSMVVTTRKLV